MTTNIEEALGKLEDSEVTQNTAKIRVTINGLQPLIQEIIINFRKGDEAKVTLVYEKLKNFCNKCYYLTYEEEDCSFKPPESGSKNKITTGQASLEPLRQHKSQSIVSASLHKSYQERRDIHGRTYGERPLVRIIHSPGNTNREADTFHPLKGETQELTRNLT